MNIRQIAQLANVTPGTVSKVINNYPDISESTREHVLKIMKEHQYTPNTGARMLKLSTKLPLVGLAIEGGNNPLYNEMEDRLTTRLHNADYTIMYFRDNHHAQDKDEKFDELIAYTKKNTLSGLIYIGGNFQSILPKRFEALACPIVFIHTILPGSLHATGYSSIRIDHFETACRQMEYIIERGHTHICTVVTAIQDTTAYHLRTQGYQQTLAQYGLAHNLQNITESHYICDKTYAELSAHLQKHPEITAVCCACDAVVPAVLRAIHDAGKTPGSDVAVVSCDGLNMMRYMLPSVTTFAQPTEEICNLTYELLIGLISGEKQHQHITFQATLRENESCPLGSGI